MKEEIVNRVTQNQKLVTFDLEDYYPTGSRVSLDIKDWLYQGLILKENDFRAHIANHDWTQYKNTYVALTCSTDAIIPGWAYLLLTSQLAPYASEVVVGTLEMLETYLYHDILSHLDYTPFQDKYVIIKGCSNKPVPPNAYTMAIQNLQPLVKSLRYGEACSSVPLYKQT
ncbi:DUF2480 family protein [Aquimarina intermedia]|uniref:Uncharacterized protein DUF2480 n=1 Tax=Aquimarina intermedia TaxID=350814 RepID=A0A5S5CF81_9FLAO|nr:DUF2480 family protein [Aquimarina intermedia]TYP76956.1 uncharacterized protein DUF2480 [Aquimarina intermedia]